MGAHGSARIAAALRRHPVRTALAAVLLVAILLFVFAPWGHVSGVRARDAEIRRAVAPLAERLEPMHVPPPVSGWDLRVRWFCDAVGLAGDTFVPVCGDVPLFSPLQVPLHFSFTSDEPPAVVCRALERLLEEPARCMVDGRRFGEPFLNLDGSLTPTVVADVQVRRALVAPGGGIVDPDHPRPDATLLTVVSLAASGGEGMARG